MRNELEKARAASVKCSEAIQDAYADAIASNPMLAPYLLGLIDQQARVRNALSELVHLAPTEGEGD